MGSIRAAIELQDNFTNILMNVINAVNMSVSTMEQMQSVMNEPIDTAAIQGMRGQFDQAAIAAQELNNTLQNMESPVAVSEMEHQVAEITNRLNGVARMQNAINTAGQNLYILPEDTVKDIKGINAEIERMQQAINFLETNPFNLDSSIVELQIQSISDSINEIVEQQQQIGNLMDNVPSQILDVEVNPVVPEQLAIPVQWQTDSLEVFTNTGVERFEMEVQGANNMLSTLNQTQAEIAARAAQTNIFPPGMVTDMNGMQERLQAIQNRIQVIEGNPLNMGTDVANAELEQLRAQFDSMIQMQSQLSAAIQNMDVSAANEAYLRLSQIIGGTERHIRDNVDEQGRFRRAVEESTDSAAGLKNMIASAVGAFAGIAGLRKAKDWIDDCTAAFNTQLNAETQLVSVLANMLDEDYAAQFEIGATADTTMVLDEISAVQDGVEEVIVPVAAETSALTAAYNQITAKASEIQGRGIYGDEAMIAAAAEFSTYFTDTDAIEMMMDTLSDYAMGMTGGGAIDSTEMVNYATNLGKIMSGSYDAMTEKGFELTDVQKAIIEGEATREQIIAALGEEYLDMSADMQAAAAITQVIDESWAGLYESMSNTPEGQIIQMTNTWGDMKEVIGGQLYPYVLLFVDAITQNWGTIQTVVDNITLGLQIMLGVMAWLMEKAINFAQGVMDNWGWISPIIYGIIGALAVYYGWQMLCAVANAILSASILLPYIAIIALIAAIFAVCQRIAEMTGVANSGFGIITGAINVGIQFFKNLGLSVSNISIGIGNAMGALASNMMIAFHNAICSVQTWFYSLLATGLLVIAGICEALNKLPFVKFDYSGITSAANDYATKAAEAVGSKEEYKSIGDAFNEGISTYDTFQDGWVSDAFDAGAAWGDGIAESIANLDPSSLFGTTDIFSADDYASALASSGIGSGVEDIAGNTGAMADAMDITGEELKYLRDIAEQEAINRFTTAEINIEQTNHNTIKNGMDLDGIISGMTDMVNEAIDISTEGVHE